MPDFFPASFLAYILSKFTVPLAFSGIFWDKSRILLEWDKSRILLEYLRQKVILELFREFPSLFCMG